MAEQAITVIATGPLTSDNLMQDMLTLQMFKLMDDLWKTNGMDFRLTLYNVLVHSVGNEVWM